MLAPRSLLLPERTIPRFSCPCSIESSPGALRPYRERCCRAVGRSAGFPGLSRPGVLLSGRALTLWSRGSQPRDMTGNSENRCLSPSRARGRRRRESENQQLCGSIDVPVPNPIAEPEECDRNWQPLSLPAEASGLDLMNEDVAAPSVLDNAFALPNSFLRVGELFQNSEIVVPSDLCKHRVHKCFFGPSLDERLHLLQVANPFFAPP